MWPKLLYLELRATGRARARAKEPEGARAACSGMSGMPGAARATPPRRRSKVQLMLRTPEGGQWRLTLSRGMERFIGHYPRVAGLGSGGPLLRYKSLDAGSAR